ncbi:TetR family transcriptional regulator [Weissella oryzae SG25]|uniref:TetR family transcriptional regulator n=1 Tax=Weissella oryzae (strain DSM 25784 / JCM 18191 / LMG 30913 / SG25) TaxID=1329250 RepID=A0A069CRD3_WEIOS|nr:TetR/AcrR family transcriptional regulator [Weissella oryzae]GAK30275.1 TetR family transcriptional regulator [Weissella oryzae SG25]
MRIQDQEKRLALKKAALTLVANDGITQLSMAKLAKATNLSVATAYIYFENKTDLLGHLYTEALEQILLATDGIELSGLPLKEQFTQVLNHYAKALLHNPLYANFIRIMNTNQEALPIDLQGQGALVSADFLTVLKLAQKQQQLRTDNVDIIVAQVIQPLFWLITERQRLAVTISDDEIATFIDMAEHAILLV